MSAGLGISISHMVMDGCEFHIHVRFRVWTSKDRAVDKLLRKDGLIQTHWTVANQLEAITYRQHAHIQVT